MFSMQGERSHACNRTLYKLPVYRELQFSVYSLSDRACDGMLIRAHENAARGHIAFSHFGDAAAVLSARGLVHKRRQASISQGS